MCILCTRNEKIKKIVVQLNLGIFSFLHKEGRTENYTYVVSAKKRRVERWPCR